MNKFFVEFFGTFTLVLVVMLSVAGKFPIPTPILAATVLGTFVYTAGFISGSQLNPVVTLGALTVGKIKLPNAIGYIISQFVGAIAAMYVANYFVGVKISQAPNSTFVMGLGELIGATLLTFGVASVVFGKTDKKLAGIVIGASLFIGIATAGSMGSAGVLSPAVSLSLGLFNPVYVVGQVVGGVLGFWIFKLLAGQK